MLLVDAVRHWRATIALCLLCCMRYSLSRLIAALTYIMALRQRSVCDVNAGEHLQAQLAAQQ